MTVRGLGNLPRRRAVLVAVAVAALAIGIAAAFGALADTSSRWIVFSGAPTDASQVQTEQLYRIHPDGSGLQQLTTGAHAAQAPVFSPGGQRIAFARVGVGIFTMSPNGTGLRRLTKGERDSYPTWAPTGGRIAFIRPVKRQWKVFVQSTSGGKPHLLAKAPPAGRPTWTPKGLLIPSGGDLLRIDTKTGRVLKYYGANIDAIWGLNTVALAPDRSKLTFVGTRAPDPGDLECGEGPCQRFALYLESLTTKAKKPRLVVKNVGPATFSPDGRQIVYVASAQLIVRSVASGSAHGLATGALAPTATAPPAWQPK
jgi:Tol biopolymer transport system component